MKRNHKKEDNKKVRNAKSKEVDGIKFRSGLESFTYRKLKEAGITNFNYEQDVFILLEGFEATIESYEKDRNKQFTIVTNKIRPMTYKPDFCCIDADKNGWIIEVKGFANDALNIIY